MAHHPLDPAQMDLLDPAPAPGSEINFAARPAFRWESARRGLVREAQPPSMADDPIDQYLCARADVRPATARAYQADLRGLAIWLAPESILAANEGDLRAWIQSEMRDLADPTDPRPCCPRTVTRKLSAAAGFFRWARRVGLVSANPFDLLDVILFETPAHPLVTEDEIDRLFRVIESSVAHTRHEKHRVLFILDIAIYRLCYHLGLRISEATGVRLSNIWEESGEVRLRVETKGGRIQEYPIVGHALAAWNRWMGVRERVSPAPGAEDLAFVHPWTGAGLSRRRAWKRLHQYARVASFRPDLLRRFTPHSFRHACAQHMDRRGVDLREIQEALGHVSATHTLHYLRATRRTSNRLEILRQNSCGPVAGNRLPLLTEAS